MNATQIKADRQIERFPRARAVLFAVISAIALYSVPVSPNVHAQVPPQPDTAQSLVYVADSDNESLNTRMRTLLQASFGGDVTLKSFTAGQAHQDGYSPVIALGPRAFETVKSENRNLPLLALFVDQTVVSASRSHPDANLSAVLNDPVLERQLATGKAILPHSTRVSMIARPDTRHLYDDLLKTLPEFGMEGRLFIVSSAERLIPTLIQALNYGDFILAASDDDVYNPRTIKHILLTAYRRNRIVIGPSQAYVKAGSLASTYTPLSDIANMAADYVTQYWETGKFPKPDHPAQFGIDVNRQVGRSLNIPLPDREDLIKTVTRSLNDREVHSDE